MKLGENGIALNDGLYAVSECFPLSIMGGNREGS